MPVERELWEVELGRVAAAAIEEAHGAGGLEALARDNAVKLLQKIQDILNDESLSDFECVEEIVLVMAGFHVSTSRHDFG